MNHHAGCRQQLVDILGQATADEVIALRTPVASEIAAAQPASGVDRHQQSGTAPIGKATDSQTSQAAAADLHDQASAAIPAGSQLANALADADTASISISKHSGPPAVSVISLSTAAAAAAAATVDSVKTEADTAQLSQPGVDAAVEAEAQVKAEAASSTPWPAAGRPSPSAVTVVRSNPRFASKPIKLEPAADSQEPEPADKAEGNALAC